MIIEEFGFGNSIEEAKEAALAKLNPGDADYKIEIVEDYKAKVLGVFGGHLAKVRAYYEVADKKETKKAPKQEKKKEAKKAPAKKRKETIETTLNFVTVAELKDGTPEKKSAEYLQNVLQKLGVEDIQIKVALIDGGAHIHVDGENIGVVIGRRGETLDALQYLASFSANAGGGNGYFRVVLDTGNYREKREETLKSLAKRISAQAIKTGRQRSLEPMSPYERRIIHTEVQDIEGVSSHSVGEGTRRHVVITPDGYTPRGERGGRNNRYKNGRPQQSNTVAAPDRAPKSDFDGEAPLYGKIG